MVGYKRIPLWTVVLVLLTVLTLAWIVQAVFMQKQALDSVQAQVLCEPITAVKQIPSPTTITFEELANGTVIGNNYRLSQGVVFENTRANLARIFGDKPGEAHSSPNVAINDTQTSSIPMKIVFDTPDTWFWLGISCMRRQAPW
jgi:hypothetical protein